MVFFRIVGFGSSGSGFLIDCIQSTSNTKVAAELIPDNCNNALIFAYGIYLEGSSVAVKGIVRLRQ